MWIQSDENTVVDTAHCKLKFSSGRHNDPVHFIYAYVMKSGFEDRVTIFRGSKEECRWAWQMIINALKREDYFCDLSGIERSHQFEKKEKTESDPSNSFVISPNFSS